MFNKCNCKKIVSKVFAAMLTLITFSSASKCQSIPETEAMELAKLVYERAQAVWEQAEKEAKEKGITLTCKNRLEVETIMGQYCPFNSDVPTIVDHKHIRRIKNQQDSFIQRFCRSFRRSCKSVVYKHKNWCLQTR